MKSLDLFSGIGGITHALRGMFHPVAYCEAAPSRIEVLRNLFAKKRIPQAPIHTDVCKLKGSQVPDIDCIVGGWPCFPAGTLVCTDEGYKPIEQVVGTEKVLTHTGHFRAIENLQRKKHPGSLYYVGCRHQCHRLKCTSEHPFYVRTLDDATPHWVQAKDLRPGYLVGLPINTQCQVPQAEIQCRVNDNLTDVQNSRFTLDQMWCLGYFVRHGWILSDTNHCLVGFTKHHERLSTSFMNLGQGKYYVKDGALWCSLPQDLYTIPEWVQQAPKSFIEAFLEGFNTYVAMEGGDEVVVSSLPLALGVQRLLAKLGKLHGVRKSTQDSRQYYVTRKGMRGCFIANGYAWYLIDSVGQTLRAGECIVYNLAVEEDQSYVVHNIAVHNCVGFSSVGKRQGFENEQSALFSEVDRLVGELRPKMVFQENVPGVASGPGLERVMQCLDKHNYDANWLVIPGYAVGAPQQRFRWFCLAVRRDVERLSVDTSGYKRYDWSREPCDRMTLGDVKQVELSMLGNSVIPDCVRLAFMMLFTNFTKSAEELWASRSLEYVRPVPSGIQLPPATTPLRYCGCMVNGELSLLPRPPIPPKPDLGLRVNPSNYRHPEPPKAAPEKIVTQQYSRLVWGTPRGGCLGPGTVCTQRSRGDLYTVLRFENNTPDHLRPGKPNVPWVCYLMGFPINWFEK